MDDLLVELVVGDRPESNSPLLPETKYVPVRIPHRELLHAVRLDYRRVHHLRAVGRELRVQGLDVADPEEHVPAPALALIRTDQRRLADGDQGNDCKVVDVERSDYLILQDSRGDWMIDEKTCGTDNGIVTSDLCITP
jgi:hypothetical protein